ncbi:hypothetical protein FRC11_013869, partial [Ceratobasidium sp. 423]
TYKLIPEFGIYNADWPIRAFIQVILKSSSDTHRKLSRSVKLGQDDSMDGQEAIDVDNASMDGELAEDAYEDEYEDAAKEADEPIMSTVNVPLGTPDIIIELGSNGLHGSDASNDGLDSDDDESTSLTQILSTLSAKYLSHTPDLTSTHLTSATACNSRQGPGDLGPSLQRHPRSSIRSTPNSCHSPSNGKEIGEDLTAGAGGV